MSVPNIQAEWMDYFEDNFPNCSEECEFDFRDKIMDHDSKCPDHE